MGITRRQFLFSIPAAGAGFILPSFFDRAVDVLARTGEPLLVPPDECITELLAVDHGSGDYQLNIGDPREGPPRLTLREYIDRYYGCDIEAYAADCCDEGESVDLDADVDEWVVMDAWARWEARMPWPITGCTVSILGRSWMLRVPPASSVSSTGRARVMTTSVCMPRMP